MGEPFDSLTQTKKSTTVESIRRVVEHTAEAYGATATLEICKKKYRLPLMILHLANWRNVSLLIH